MFHIFTFYKSDMAFGIVNRFSGRNIQNLVYETMCENAEKSIYQLNYM